MRDHDFGTEPKNVDRMGLSIFVPESTRVTGILRDIEFAMLWGPPMNLRPAREWDTKALG